MSQELADTLAALGRLGGWIDAALRQGEAAPGRALLLARMLQQIWPAAPLAACLLHEAGGTALAALDAAAAERPDWHAALRADLLKVEEAGPAPEPAELPEALALAGHPLVAARVAAGGRCRGVLAVALPAGPPEQVSPRLAVLSAAADALALRLEVEGLRAELDVESRLATLGELARPVTHEFNNFLNLLLLQMVVLEAEVPEQRRTDLKEIRRQGKAVASLIHQYQRYRPWPGRPTAADLNRAAREAAEALPDSADFPGEPRRVFLPPGRAAGGGGIAVELRLADGLPPVAGNVWELRRLCLLLLKNAAAAVDPAAGVLTLRTERAGERVVARFEDNGPSIPEGRLPQPFDATVPAREGTAALELAACRSIARRLGGNLSAENRPGGGVAFVLDLPAAETRSR